MASGFPLVAQGGSDSQNPSCRLVASRGIRFNAHPVVHRVPELLFAPEVALGCLNRDVPEEELDLVQFAPGQVTQAGTGTSQIVRASLAMSASAAACRTTSQSTFAVSP
jgi:hypothetical protein